MAVERAPSRSPSQHFVYPAGPSTVVSPTPVVPSSPNVWPFGSHPLSTGPRSPSPRRYVSDVVGVDTTPPVRRATTPEARITWFDALSSGALSVKDASLDSVFDRSSKVDGSSELDAATPFERALQGSVGENRAAHALANFHLNRKGGSIFRSIGRCGNLADFNSMWDVAADRSSWPISIGLLESALQAAASATSAEGTGPAADADAIVRRIAEIAQARSMPALQSMAVLSDLLKRGKPDLIIDLLESGLVQRDAHHGVVTALARKGQLDVARLTRLHEQLNVEIGTRFGMDPLTDPAQSPLRGVAQHGQLEAVRYILDHVNEAPIGLYIAAARAARNGHMNVVEALAAVEKAPNIPLSNVYAYALSGALGEDIGGAGTDPVAAAASPLVEQLLRMRVVPTRGHLSSAADRGDIDAIDLLLDAGMLDGRENMKLDRRVAKRIAAANRDVATNSADKARYGAVVKRLDQHLANFPSVGGMQMLTTALSRFSWRRSAPVVAPERQPLLGARR